MSGTWDNDYEGDWANDEPEVPSSTLAPAPAPSAPPRRTSPLGAPSQPAGGGMSTMPVPGTPYKKPFPVAKVVMGTAVVAALVYAGYRIAQKD